MVTISHKGKKIGSIDIQNKEIIFSSDFNNKELVNEITKIARDGIPFFVFKDENDKHSAFLEKSYPGDKDFMNHLLIYLKKIGYEDYEETIHLNEKILILANKLNSLEIINKVKKEVPTMNYLEKTYILYELEKFVD